MKKLFCVSGFVVLIAAACSTMPAMVSQPVLAGMTPDELRASFGPPLRVVGHADGSEDWYYNFGTQTQGSRPVSETTETARERSVSYGVESSTSVTYSEGPVRISPAGRVTGEIPIGQIVIR